MSDFPDELAPKTLLITGATGFIGQYVVTTALRQGYVVRAVVRPTSPPPDQIWRQHPRLTIMRGDLRDPKSSQTMMAGADAVIHLAAAKQGSYQEQYEATVKLTESLIDAMVAAGVGRLVAISTFSVFDYWALPPQTKVDEQSPLESVPTERDGYAQTKLLQEERLRTLQRQGPVQVTIVRPGMVYGRDHIWNSRLGLRLSSNRWLLIGGQATIPLAYVENCAEAIVQAVGQPESVGQILNIVDDDLPTQTEFCRHIQAYLSPSPRTLTFSWPLMAGMADALWQINRSLFRGRLPLPGLLVPRRLHARFKPLSYSNQLAKQTLAWSPRYSLAAALRRSFSCQDLLNPAEN